MPNTTPLFRQNAILVFIRKKPYSSFAEIENYVNRKLEDQYFDDNKTKSGFSKRTFERDVKDIAQLYGTVILYAKKVRGYYIESSFADNALDQMLASFDVLNALKLTANVAPFVFLEDRKPTGTEHLFGLLHAIQNKMRVYFTHQKFWEERQTNRSVKPLAIKEFKHRWYLVAMDEKDNKVKTFGLDRISDLTITKQRFVLEAAFDTAKKYKDCFGVIGADGQEPAYVVLSFSVFQGKFIKSLPLHHSQQTLKDNQEEVRVSLKIFATHDFIMELMSFGKEVKVVEPAWLNLKLKENHLAAAKN